MNKAQYNIVKFFLGMNATSKQIAKGFGISVAQVEEVEVSINFEMYSIMSTFSGGVK